MLWSVWSVRLRFPGHSADGEQNQVDAPIVGPALFGVVGIGRSIVGVSGMAMRPCGTSYWSRNSSSMAILRAADRSQLL